MRNELDNKNIRLCKIKEEHLNAIIELKQTKNDIKIYQKQINDLEIQ